MQLKFDLANNRGSDGNATKQPSAITKDQCLQLIRHVIEHEDINPDEDRQLSQLEVELMADIITEELTARLDNLVPFASSEAPAMLEAFLTWAGTADRSRRIRRGVKS